MSVYDDELVAASRTPQELLVLGVRYCANWYAQTVDQDLSRTEEFEHTAWVPVGVTITPNSHVAPDGTTTADRLDFAAVGDYIRNGASSFTAASNAFTESVYVRTVSGSGTITISCRDGSGAGSEVATKQVAITTAWTRISVHKLFTGSASGGVQWRLSRETGDLASVVAWGANSTQNPGDADREILYPYRKRVSEAGTDNNVRASRCQASDAGDGNRCHYSSPTCQDIVNFNPGNSYEGTPSLRGIREFRFCYQDRPLPLPGEDVLPLLRRVAPMSQKIDPERAVTVSEQVEFELEDDAAPGLWDAVKSGEGALVNTATGSGTFWPRFMAIFRNYSNPDGYLIRKVGFVAPGATEAADFKQRGKYLVNNLMFTAARRLKMRCTDRLRLLTTKVPGKISETNLINGAMTSGQTTMVVDDGGEITPTGTGYTVTYEIEYDVPANREFVNVTGALAGNTVPINRGRWGTTAKTHADNSKFREILMYGTERDTPSLTPLGKNFVDVVIEILKRGGLTASEINEVNLQAQRDLWLPSSVNTTTGAQSGFLCKRAGITPDEGNGGIAKQTDLEALLGSSVLEPGEPISGIRAVIMLDLHVGEDQRVDGRLFTPVEPTVTLNELTEDEHLVEGSVEVDDNEESRVSRVVVARDLNPGGEDSNLDDYANVTEAVALPEEGTGSYGKPDRTMVILSPWIMAGGSAIANTLALHVLNRFKNTARRVGFTLELKDDGNKVGDFVFFTHSAIQKASGVTDAGRIMQLLSKDRDESNLLRYQSMDTNLTTKTGFWAPSGWTDYDSATPQQKRYGHWADSQGRVGMTKDVAYHYW